MFKLVAAVAAGKGLASMSQNEKGQLILLAVFAGVALVFLLAWLVNARKARKARHGN